MCDQHSTIPVHIPAASERGPHGRKRGIDRCIAPLVDALNRGGWATIASCCGHGYRPGRITIAGGTEVFLVRSDDAERVEALFPLTCYGEPVSSGVD